MMPLLRSPDGNPNPLLLTMLKRRTSSPARIRKCFHDIPAGICSFRTAFFFPASVPEKEGLVRTIRNIMTVRNRQIPMEPAGLRRAPLPTTDSIQVITMAAAYPIPRVLALSAAPASRVRRYR